MVVGYGRSWNNYQRIFLISLYASSAIYVIYTQSPAVFISLLTLHATPRHLTGGNIAAA